MSSEQVKDALPYSTLKPLLMQTGTASVNVDSFVKQSIVSLAANL